MGFDFIVIAPPHHLIFFGELQCLLVSDCSAVSCDFGAFARGSLNYILKINIGLPWWRSG